MENNKVPAVVPGMTHGNPFAVAKRDHVNAGTVEIESSRAIAEAQGKLVIAKKFPRDQAAAYEKVIRACSRRGLAEASMYSYPRGGEIVKGPSIRLAEELARSWGNIEYGIRELSQREGESEMEAFCWDLETNVISSQKFTVKHERHTKKGVSSLTDPRDIYELTANMAGRRLRARILAVLPPDIIDDAVTQCARTLAGENNEPLVDRVRKMLKAFSVFGVNKEHIEARIGKPLDGILSDEFVDLQSIYAAIKDGMAKPSDFFGGGDYAPQDDSAIGKLNAKAKQGQQPKENKIKEASSNEAVNGEASHTANMSAASDASKGDGLDAHNNQDNELL